MNEMPTDKGFQLTEKNSTEVKCESKGCSSVVFIPGVVCRKVSVILSPTGKEELFQVPVLICSECNTVLKT